MVAMTRDPDLETMVSFVEIMHGRIRAAVRARLPQPGAEDALAGPRLAAIAAPGAGDEQLWIDMSADEIILDSIERAGLSGIVSVVAEGLGETGEVWAPDSRWVLLVDPIDGSREIGHNKRSAWILTGLAAAADHRPTLQDIVYARQTEISPSFQSAARELYAYRSEPYAYSRWVDLRSNTPLSAYRPLRSTDDSSIAGRLAPFARYFAEHQGAIGCLSDRVYRQVLSRQAYSAAGVLDDQYITSAGMLHLLASGEYAMVADLRPLVATESGRPGRCAHPYDLSTVLIAERSGAIVEDLTGAPLNYAFDTTTNCTWIAYANPAIRGEVSGTLREVAKQMASEGMLIASEDETR